MSSPRPRNLPGNLLQPERNLRGEGRSCSHIGRSRPDRLQRLSSGPARLSDRNLYCAFVSSTALHVVVVIVLGSLFDGGAIGLRERSIESRWIADEHDAQPLIAVTSIVSETDSPGASDSAGDYAASSVLAYTAIENSDVSATPRLAVDDPIPALNSSLTPTDLAETDGSVRWTSTSRGSGVSAGTTDGTGSGSGFFDNDVTGKRIVFVVDCSGSMNMPHNSRAGTRFRCLKLELVNSIGSMTEDSEFFIVFFNDHARPMPARSMVRATPQVRRKYLKWMTRIRAIGPTDPREALMLALRLQPEIVYFLTDGRFKQRVEQRMFAFVQDRIPIHTFAFGDKDAEPVMKAVAAANNGVYHYVP